jgi:DNA polymerase IV
MPVMRRRIAHLDMDAFYASVELLRYPQLKGLALVIGGRGRCDYAAENASAQFPRLSDYAGRGVATTATYEARALGVHSGMGLMKAARLAPDALLLPPDFDRYTRYSRLFKAAVASIAPRIEDRGIDEIYIDLTDVAGETGELAQRIKNKVRQATGLSSSIGVAPNKLLAKIASDLNKPDALTVVSESDIAARIWPLSARKINGVGPRTSAKLAALGIQTIGDLAHANATELIEHFGKHYGLWLIDAALGRDESAVVTEREPKSISRETTFERDLDPRGDRELLSQILLDLCERLSADLSRKGYAGKTIGVRLRYADFTTVTRDVTLELATGEAETIRGAVRTCLKRIVLDRKLRLLGVRVGSLLRIEAQRLDGGARRNAVQESNDSLRLFD